jgi:hypothetical protein
VAEAERPLLDHLNALLAGPCPEAARAEIEKTWRALSASIFK